MINEIINEINIKKVIILGFGREGRSTYKFIRKYLPNKKLYIGDIQDLKNDELIKNDNNIELKCGTDYLDNLNDYDLIIKTPGITFKDIDTKQIYNKISSQLELLLKYSASLTISVTGTKGKSTTSSLIYKIFQDQDREAVFAGNIGIPIFDKIEEMTKDKIIVLENSSHQLEFLHHSPNIGIFLNIFEEHLDHHNNYDEYINAKSQIFRNQTVNDYILYNSDFELIRNKISEFKAKGKKISVTYENKQDIPVNNDLINIEGENVCYNHKPLYNINNPRKLLGNHNLNDIMFVLGVAKILKLDMEKVEQTIENFNPLEHRLENAGTYNNITYYNDSISTIPAATINAVNALKNVNTLIIGGMDRGIHYQPLIDFLNSSDIEHIICMPNTGHTIAKELTNNKAILVQDLAEAVEKAKEVTKPNTICLLSPAAASYGFFKNFEERGEKYKELIAKK